MHCMIILRDRTLIGRDAESIEQGVRHREGPHVITAAPVGSIDHESRLPLYMELSRETLSDEEVIRIENEEAEKRAAAVR